MRFWLMIVTALAVLLYGCATGRAPAGPGPEATATAPAEAPATAPAEAPATAPAAGAGSAAAADAQAGQVVNQSPAEVQRRLDAGEQLLVLDVREDWEFAEGHIPGARLLPLGSLEQRLAELDPQVPVVVVCRSGNRSAQGAAILAGAGFQAVYNMTGGMRQWQGQVEK